MDIPATPLHSYAHADLHHSTAAGWARTSVDAPLSERSAALDDDASRQSSSVADLPAHLSATLQDVPGEISAASMTAGSTPSVAGFLDRFTASLVVNDRMNGR